MCCCCWRQRMRCAGLPQHLTEKVSLILYTLVYIVIPQSQWLFCLLKQEAQRKMPQSPPRTKILLLNIHPNLCLETKYSWDNGHSPAAIGKQSGYSSIVSRCLRKSYSNHNFISVIMKITKGFFFKATKNSQQKIFSRAFIDRLSCLQQFRTPATEAHHFFFASLSAEEIFVTVAVSLEISMQHKGAACYQSSRRRQRQIKSNEKTRYRYRGDCDYQRANGFVMVRTELRRIPSISNGFAEKSLQTIKVLCCSLSHFPCLFFSLLVGWGFLYSFFISPLLDWIALSCLCHTKSQISRFLFHSRHNLRQSNLNGNFVFTSFIY